MELSFERTEISCLDCVLAESRNLDLSKEVHLPEGMPDIDRVLGAWGQSILRSRTVHSDCVSLTGGMMVWIAYAAEDGSVQTLDEWLPMQLDWDLPPECPQCSVCVCSNARFSETRTASPRKLSLHCGMALEMEVYTPAQAEIFTPKPQDLCQCKCSKYPLTLWKETGEKTFPLEDDLAAPADAERIVYCALRPNASDVRVLGERLAFRGEGRLHVVYLTQTGQIRSEDYPMAFSQVEELAEIYGESTQGRVMLSVAALESSLTAGTLKIRSSLCAQYTLLETQTVEICEDAYAPGRAVNCHASRLEVNAVLDSRSVSCESESTASLPSGAVADVCLWTDVPQRQRTRSCIQTQLCAQVLSVDENGKLQGNLYRWEAGSEFTCHEGANLMLRASAVKCTAKPGRPMSASVNLDTLTCAPWDRQMVTGVEIGQAVQSDAPSLIVKRIGKESLWELAKGCDSTVDAIRSVNALTQDPDPGTMLIIPVCG